MPRLLVEFQIEVLSEYHVGTGLGRPGYTDAVLHRRPDGPAILPAESLRGVARDAAARLVAILGLERQGWATEFDLDLGVPEPGKMLPADANTDTVFARVFGTSQRPRLWRFADGEPVGEPVDEDKEDAYTVQFHNHVDPLLGRVRSGRFYSQEMGPATVFQSHVTRLASADQAAEVRDELALLVAALQFIEGVGARRSRGAGRCRVTVTGCETGGLAEVPSDIASLVDHLIGVN